MDDHRERDACRVWPQRSPVGPSPPPVLVDALKRHHRARAPLHVDGQRPSCDAITRAIASGLYPPRRAPPHAAAKPRAHRGARRPSKQSQPRADVPLLPRAAARRRDRACRLAAVRLGLVAIAMCSGRATGVHAASTRATPARPPSWGNAAALDTLCWVHGRVVGRGEAILLIGATRRGRGGCAAA